MALQWADFPSGQRGLYGVDANRMLDGVWAELATNLSQQNILANDPDPNIGSEGVVLTHGNSAVFPRVSGGRLALPTPRKTIGVGFRLWLSQLPANNDQCPVVSFRNSANSTLFAIRILSNGGIEVRSVDSNGGTLHGTSTGPVVTANAYIHLEIKGFSDAAAGTVQVKKEGTTVSGLNLTGLNTNGADIAQLMLGTNTGFSTNGTAQPYFKDLIIWDTTGSYVNDFQGAVAVYDIVPDADDDLQWVPSTGSTGFNLIDDVNPSNTLTASGAISDGEVVRIDNTYYRFSSGSLDSGPPAGTSSNPWRVKIEAAVADTLQNLFKAIGATGVAGTTYSTALTAHATVDADGYTATQVSVTAKLSNASAIVVTETGANLTWLGTGLPSSGGAGILNNGATDPSYISADNTPPSPSKFTMTDLPPDVVTVRAVMPIGRMVKSDGGDCNVLMSVSPDDVDYFDGTDRPITTASTFWWDVSHTSPVTSAPWTPDEVDSMVFKIDRTV